MRTNNWAHIHFEDIIQSNFSSPSYRNSIQFVARSCVGLEDNIKSIWCELDFVDISEYR